jgi:hypothetical protein
LTSRAPIGATQRKRYQPILFVFFVAILIENSNALAALAERESTPAGNREWTRRDANKTIQPKRVGTTRST